MPNTPYNTQELLEQGNVMGQRVSQKTGVPFTPVNIPQTFDTSTVTQPQQEIAMPIDTRTNTVDTFQSQILALQENMMKNLEEARLERLERAGELEEEAGISETETQLGDIRTQVAARIGGLQTGLAKIGEQPIPTPLIRGQQAALQTRELAQISALQAQEAALTGNLATARDAIDRALELEFMDENTQIQLMRDFMSANVDMLSTKEKLRLQEQIEAQERVVAEAKAEKMQVLQWSVDYPQAGIQLSDSLEMARNKIQPFLIQAGVAGEGGEPTPAGIIPNIPSDATGEIPAEELNKAILVNLLNDKRIGQGARTQIGTILGVLNAAKGMAEARQTSGFKGISPLNAILDVKIPFTDIGLPFRETLRSQEGAENVGYLEAINLKVQQWASGAALTEKQTEQVARFTPVVTDTDAKVKTKLNNLYNFMLEQVQGSLEASGIRFEPQRVDLFETQKLLEKASLEQLEQLKQEGLIQ